MTQLDHAPDPDAMNVAKALAGLTILAVLTAGVAGAVLLLADPASGSTLESSLGLTAAVAGLSAAVLAIATLIYAQIKNLWRYAPSWVRITAWALIAAVAAIPIIRAMTN